MTARVTQQVLTVAYSTSPPIRVTSLAVEIIRSTSTVPEAPGAKPQVIVVAG